LRFRSHVRVAPQQSLKASDSGALQAAVGASLLNKTKKRARSLESPSLQYYYYDDDDDEGDCDGNNDSGKGKGNKRAVATLPPAGFETPEGGLQAAVMSGSQGKSQSRASSSSSAPWY
jgi:hypothetical protein